MTELYYSQNPEWADITPIPLDNGPSPLVSIAYKKQYSEALGYFRAVSSQNEKSERVLSLTADIISMISAHYTVWNYRQQVLFALDSDLEEELDYIDEIAPDQAKNYQVWHHRQVIVDQLDKADRELPFINAILDEDAKNYHGWAYRQWVVRRFGLWDKEIDYTSDLLVFDIRNNSAWNHRYFVLFNKPQTPSEQEIDDEISFVKKQITLAPNNSSSWSYLKVLFEKSNRKFSALEPFLKQLIDAKTDSHFISIMYVDIYEQNARLEKTPVNPAAIDICTVLAEKQDVIREKYWHYRKQRLQNLR